MLGIDICSTLVEHWDKWLEFVNVEPILNEYERISNVWNVLDDETECWNNIYSIFVCSQYSKQGYDKVYKLTMTLIEYLANISF